MQRAGEVNASNGIKDVDVAWCVVFVCSCVGAAVRVYVLASPGNSRRCLFSVLQRVGALCNFDAIMDDESQHYRSLRVNIDMVRG